MARIGAWVFRGLVTLALTLFLTSYLIVILLFINQTFGTSFPEPSYLGDPLLIQHVLWFFGRPEVWLSLSALAVVLIGAGLGLVSLIRMGLWGGLVLCISLIVGLALSIASVFASRHRHFTSGDDLSGGWVLYPPLAEAKTVSLIDRLLDFTQSPAWLGGVAILSIAALVFAATQLWRRQEAAYRASALALTGGALTLALMGIGAIVIFARSVDTTLHDTYYTVAHAHQSIAVALGFVFFASTYSCLVAAFSLRFRHWLVLPQVALFTTGVWLANLLPLLFAGPTIPRRYIDYSDRLPLAFETLQTLADIGYFATLISLALFAISLVEAILRKIAIRTST